MQKALISWDVFLDFIELNCKVYLSYDPNDLAQPHIKRKIIQELLNRQKESKMSYEIGHYYPVRKI